MLGWFVQNALIATALSALIWPLCRIRRLGPALRHALWLVVLLKLLTPPLLTWPWPMPSVFGYLHPERITAALRSFLPSDPAVNRSHAELSPETNGVVGWSSALPLLVPSVNSPESPNEWYETAIDARVAGIQPEGLGDAGATLYVPNVAESGYEPAAAWLIPVVVACWLVGTAVSISIHALQVIRFIRLIADCQPAPLSLTRRVQAIAVKMGVLPPRLVVAAGIRSPVIWGGFTQQLIWPACLPGDFESRRWDGVIAHELAHLRRRDHWVGWLELLAGCIWWWNPLFWYVRHQLRENSELACDALVVWALPDGRRRYAESLIEVVSHFSQTVTAAPVLGVNTVGRQAFERRLIMILCERVPWKLSVRGLLAIGLLALVAIPGWSRAQAPASPASQQPPTIELIEVPVSPPVASQQIPALPVISDAESVEPAAAPAVVTEVELVPTQNDESRIDALEKKLEAIIAEVRALRTNPRPVTQYQALNQQPMVAARTYPKTQVSMQPRYTETLADGASVQLLSRGTYALPKAKADALAAFLREHVKSVEASVKDDDGKVSLIVTAAPDAQAAIAQLVALSEGKPLSSATQSLLYRTVGVGVPVKQPPSTEPVRAIAPPTTPAARP
jgi:beta-lactamase regulating signal transducer with metallopeptidase domain